MPYIPRSFVNQPLHPDSLLPPFSTFSAVREPKRATGTYARQVPPIVHELDRAAELFERREALQRERATLFMDSRHKSPRKVAARRVHFDLPTRPKKQHASGHDDYFHRTPRQDPHTTSRPPNSAPAQPLPRPLRSILTQPPPPPLASPPIQPTIYILTYSTDRTPTSKAFKALLKTHLPRRDPPISHLYTIDASSMSVPPAHLCRLYSGLSPIIQAHVMQDARAQTAIRQGVTDLLDFETRERRRSRNGVQGELRGREVAMSVCCHAGTHRSVAIADLIAQEVRGEVRRLGLLDGVRVVVRHVHRVKGAGDLF